MLISTLLESLYTGTVKLGKSRFWLFLVGLIFLIVIFINGIGIVPEEPYQRLAENPLTTRTDIHFNNYWQENPLLSVVAFYLRLSSPKAFNILCFAVISGAFLLFALWSSKRWGPTPALIFSGLLITSPLTTVMLTWLGTPDGLTLALTIPFLFTRSSVLLSLLSALGAANHPAFMIAALEILILRWVAKEEIKLQHILASAFGIALGYGLVRAFLTINQIEVVSRLDFMLLKDADEWLKLNALNFPMSITSLFNIQWLVILLCLVMVFKRDRIFYSLVVGFLLANYGLTFFTLDTTRIFSLLSWGVMFTCVFHSYKLTGEEGENEPEAQKQFLQSLILIGIVSLLTPRYFSWLGEIHTTPFYQFLRKVFR